MHAISAVLVSSLTLTALYLSKRPEVAQEIRLDQGMISAKGRSAKKNKKNNGMASQMNAR